MIPEFPNFKLIELSDCEEMKGLTAQFPPYSDFNFTSLWSWNLIDEIALSKLNGNLVVRFTDYVTNEPFYSFIGNQMLNETCAQLIDFSTTSGLAPKLRLIPEVIAQQLDGEKFKIAESRDHFDYIYNISDLRDYPGRKYSKKRNHVSGFTKHFPQAVAREISLKDEETVKQVLGLFDKWHSLKIQKEKGESDSGLHDLAAMKRLLLGVSEFNLVSVGIFIDESLVALFVTELVDKENVVAHMMKADTSIDDGLYAFLMKKNAEILSGLGIRFFNYEQDLGIQNLRIGKSRFYPCAFLKKYNISYAHKE